MNRLDALRVFCIAAESVNFREAAARIGISPQVVTRAVRQLEDEMGEPLFHRSTRGVRLTHFGENVAKRGLQALSELNSIFSGSGDLHEGVTGTVRIAAPSVLGRRFITKGLAPCLQSYPGLKLDVRVSDVIADVVGEQIDVGVRIGPMRDSRFVAKPVSKASLYFVASPELIKRCGRPKSKSELLNMPLSVLIDRNTGRPWPWMFKDGDHMVSDPVFTTDDAETECEAVMAGISFSQLPGHLALPLMRAGLVESVVERLRPPSSTLYVYRPYRTPVPKRVRIIFDALCELLANCEEISKT